MNETRTIEERLDELEAKLDRLEALNPPAPPPLRWPSDVAAEART